MKKILTLALGLFCFVAANAQTASEGSLTIGKEAQPCAVINFNNIAPELLENTLKQIFAEAKLGDGDRSKGVRVYKGVVWPAISGDKMDYYYKVDGKKNNSTVYLAASKGYTNFVNRSNDSATFNRMAAFLVDLQRASTRYQLSEDIKAAEEEVKKDEKSYNSSVSDGKDLQKELERLQKQIEENKATQAKKLEEWEAAKKKLAELKARFQ